MVAGNKQLEGRHEVEKVLPHEAGRQPITTGQGFDFGFVPAASLLRFLRHNQASTAQLCQISRVALGVTGDKSTHIGHRGVVPEDAGDEVDKGALAIRAGAIAENKRVLGREAGAAISNVALQESL